MDKEASIARCAYIRTPSLVCLDDEIYPDRQKKRSQPTSTTRLDLLSDHPKGWKRLAVVTKESNKINAASDVNVVKKIMT